MVTLGVEQVISQDAVSDETPLDSPRGQKLHVEPRDCSGCNRQMRCMCTWTCTRINDENKMFFRSSNVYTEV